MTTDFCPWANRFVYWLKEPIGWFVLATAVSVMIGLYLNPIGWTLAASLLAIMIVGMAWPLVAIHVTTCSLRPEIAAVHEGESCRMIFTVRNRIPLPVWGLAVEGYLDCEGDDSAPTVGLACVAPLSVSDYGIVVRPQLRGHYPAQMPTVSCAFPFGIWTARRKLAATKPLTVWPKVYSISGTCPLVGRANADQGDGQRGGRSGDFVGVRAYRRGDAAKHVNWIASARTDSLIVTERGGPQCVELDVWVDTRIANSVSGKALAAGSTRPLSPPDVNPRLAPCGSQQREQLADRIRVAASVLLNLHQSATPMRITIGDQPLRCASGAKGRTQILNALASVPANGCQGRETTRPMTKNASIEITSQVSGECVANITDPVGGRRAGGCTRTSVIRSGRDFAELVRGFWMEVRDVDAAA